MAYNLIVTDKADKLIDERVSYLIIKFKNPQAAVHLLDEISGIYDSMADNPYQFPDSKGPFLLRRGYKEAYIPDMNYKMVFRIDGNDVYIVGLFHDLEDYVPKVTG